MLKIYLGLAILAFATVIYAHQHVLIKPLLGRPMDEANVERLLDQAVKYSRYSKPIFARPRVDLVPANEWRQPGALGYFDPKEPSTVHIQIQGPDSFQTTDSVIVHELVHWLQKQSGWEWKEDCADYAAHEAEAYGVSYVRDTAMGIERRLWVPDIYLLCVMSEDK